MDSSGGSEMRQKKKNATEELTASNKKIVDNLLRMLSKIKAQKKSNQIYEAKLFVVCTEVLKSKEPLTFKQTCSKIGTSLRDDFSEIDSNNGEAQPQLTPNEVRICFKFCLGNG